MNEHRNHAIPFTFARTARATPRRASAAIGAAVVGWLLGAGLPAAHAQAAAPAPVAARPDCREIADPASRQACRREHRAARQAAHRGQLTSLPQPMLLRNALARCQPLPEEDRRLCERRILGEGKVDGSVAGGGLLRELRIVVPAEEATSAAPAPRDGAG